MESQVQELIDKIKKDGVESAEKSAKEIIDKAKEEAKRIVKDAESRAEEAEKNASREAERFKVAGEEALKQASRNVLISFRAALLSELSSLIRADVKSVYSVELLKNLIPVVVGEWAKKSEASELSVLLSERDLSEVEASLKSALSSLLEKGLTLKADKALKAGFRVGIKGGEAYYDYSAEAVAELLSAYINPRLSEIMKKALASGE